MDRPVARRMLFAVVLVFACALPVLRGHDARANMAKWWSAGEAHGALVPQGDTEVRVDSEDLSFVVAPSLDRADVTATYHMTNGGQAATHADVAFVMVASELAGSGVAAPSVLHASVTIDGAPLAGRVVTEADVLGPALEAWLASHPDAEPELQRLAALPTDPRYADYDALRRRAPGCTGECRELLGWYRNRKSLEKHTTDEDRRELVVRAAEAAVPTEVAVLQNGWSNLGSSRRLSWLAFPLEIAAGASRTITVRYTHVAGSDMSHAVSTVFTYEYLLSPAKRWARFGELHLMIQMPPASMVHASSLPFIQEGGGATYRANLPGLPDGELSFEVMSRKGLLFGMTQPWGYWLLLLAAMALVTIPIAARLGRFFGRDRSRAWMTIGCVFGTGLAALVSNGAVAAALSAVFPEHAFGHGYGAAFGLIGVVPLLAVGAVVVSLVTARRSRR